MAYNNKKNQSKWRAVCAPIIAKVLADNPKLNESELRKLISKQYPFGQRSLHPYKIWLDEIRVQLGIKKFILHPDKDQLKLF